VAQEQQRPSPGAATKITLIITHVMAPAIIVVCFGGPPAWEAPPDQCQRVSWDPYWAPHEMPPARRRAHLGALRHGENSGLLDVEMRNLHDLEF
jgi:hypothetical protein